MKISSRFSVAVHILVLIEYGKDQLLTSEFIASSVNTNPVVIRRIMLNLKNEGLIEVKGGTGGAKLLKSPRNITLFDIYQAGNVVNEGELFNIHDNTNLDCPVGAKIQKLLEIFLIRAQKAMEDVLKNVTLQDLLEAI